ncbi:MAG TPA: DUF4823 domain-containing protein [Myxococcota bacterium]
MNSKLSTLCAPLLALVACAHTYDVHSSPASNGPLLPLGASVLVGLPLDGHDGHSVYEGSGALTAESIVAALRRYTEAAEVAGIAETLEEYEARAREAGQQFVLFPEIFVWKDRNTRRWGLPDLLELQLTLVDVATGEVLDTTTISASSRIGLSWDDRPQDLLPVPLEGYAARIFQDR